MRLLIERGPDVGRPTVDRVQASRHHNTKELRTSRDGALRVLFMFEPRRQVIVLLGGDKTGHSEGLVSVGDSDRRRSL